MSTDPLLLLMADTNNVRCNIMATPTGDLNSPVPVVVKTSFDVLLLSVTAEQRLKMASDYEQTVTHTAQCCDDTLLKIGCRLAETHTRNEIGTWLAVASGTGARYVVLGKEKLPGMPAALAQVRLILSQESPVL